MTLEAAFCLPLFLFFCFCLIVPMKMMDRQRQIQAALEQVGEALSRYAYVGYCFEDPDRNPVDVERANEDSKTGGADVMSLLTSGWAEASVREHIDSRWLESVSFARTRIGEDDRIDIVMEYRMKLPFSVLGQHSISAEAVCSRRMWVGADGGRGAIQGKGQENKEKTVYIGKGSVRYHMSRTCHYLYNELKEVSYGELSSLRNAEGRRYSPCAVCAQSGDSGSVYVMPHGSSYHTCADCRAISAYVQEVPLSEVETLGACSYCGGAFR